jgi:hypothetical protein
MRRIRANISAVEKQSVLHILSGICSLKYLACNAHVPYFHQRPARLSNIFPYYLIHNTICENRLLKKNRVFSSSLQRLSQSFLILRRSVRKHDQQCILGFVYSNCYSCKNLMNLEFSRQIFEKCSDIKFTEHLFSGSLVGSCGRTD